MSIVRMLTLAALTTSSVALAQDWVLRSESGPNLVGNWDYYGSSPISAMAYDSMRAESVLVQLSGYNWDGGVKRLSVWTLGEEGDWTERETIDTDLPAEDYQGGNMAVAFDSRNNGRIVIVYIGKESYGSGARVWTWNGSTLSAATANGLPETAASLDLYFDETQANNKKMTCLLRPSDGDDFSKEFDWNTNAPGSWTARVTNRSATPRFNIPSITDYSDLLNLRAIPRIPRISRLPLGDNFSAEFDPLRRRAVVWQAAGGEDPSAPSVSFLSEWSGTAWDSKPLFMARSNRYFTTAFDPIRGKLLAFGASPDQFWGGEGVTLTSRLYELNNSSARPFEEVSFESLHYSYRYGRLHPVFCFDSVRKVAILVLQPSNGEAPSRTYELERELPAPEGFVFNVSDETVYRGQSVQCVAANSLSEPFESIEFWRDSNESGQWEATYDKLLSRPIPKLNGTIWSSNITVGPDWIPGTDVNLFAVATDRDSQLKSVKMLPIEILQAPPIVGRLVITPARIASENVNIQLQALNVTDADSGISQIRFYFDADGSQSLSPTDPLVGSVSTAATKLTVNFGTLRRNGVLIGEIRGNERFFAQAIDTSGILSEPVSSTVYVNIPPVVEVPSTNIDTPIPAGAVFNLETACTDSDGTVRSVEFYLDTYPPFGEWTSRDRRIAVGTRRVGTNDFFATIRRASVSISPGDQTIFAVAKDNENATATSEPGVYEFE